MNTTEFSKIGPYLINCFLTQSWPTCKKETNLNNFSLKTNVLFLFLDISKFHRDMVSYSKFYILKENKKNFPTYLGGNRRPVASHWQTITFCDKVCQWLATGWWFSPGPPVSSTNKTDCHDITEILLKESSNIIKANQPNLPMFNIYGSGLGKLTFC